MLTIAELAGRTLHEDLLDDTGLPREPVLLVDLDSGGDVAAAADAAVHLAGRAAVLVGVASGPVDGQVDALVEVLDLTVAPSGAVDRRDRRVVAGEVAADLDALTGAAARHPRAALALCGLLRTTASLPVEAALLAESFAYSMLLAGPEHAVWLAGRGPCRPAPGDGPAVQVERRGDVLEVVLDRPDRRNAYGRQMRDELVDALVLLDADASIESVELRGAGPAFCSGGDLDEFGCAPDPATAHVVRSVRSAAWLLHRHRDVVRAHVHGGCIGAGVELPAFAGSISASSDAWFRLPELSMGLVPGAGGTVSVPRRIGRWRTTYLALTGADLPAGTALDWGLVDEVVPAERGGVTDPGDRGRIS